MYIFTRFFYWTKYHWKFEQVAEAVSCKNLLWACSVIKKRLRRSCFQYFSGKFSEHLAHQLLKLFHSSFFFIWIVLTQLTFTYSKSTTETLEESVKYVKVTIKTPERRHWRRSCDFNANFGHVSQQFLVFLWLNLNQQLFATTLTCLISNESKVEISF